MDICTTDYQPDPFTRLSEPPPPTHMSSVISGHNVLPPALVIKSSHGLGRIRDWRRECGGQGGREGTVVI